jgi:hypothetical protein
MRNRYAGPCRDCGGHVAEGEGYFHKQPRGVWPKWCVRCITCVAQGKLARGDSLTPPQRDALNPKCREHGWRLPCKTCGASQSGEAKPS